MLASTKKGSLDDTMYVTQQMKTMLKFWTKASEDVALAITEAEAKLTIDRCK